MILEIVFELSVADILTVEVSGLMDGDESLWRMIPGSLLVSMKLDMLIYGSQTLREIEMLGSGVLKSFILVVCRWLEEIE